MLTCEWHFKLDTYGYRYNPAYHGQHFTHSLWLLRPACLIQMWASLHWWYHYYHHCPKISMYKGMWRMWSWQGASDSETGLRDESRLCGQCFRICWFDFDTALWSDTFDFCFHIFKMTLNSWRGHQQLGATKGGTFVSDSLTGNFSTCRGQHVYSCSLVDNLWIK